MIIIHENWVGAMQWSHVSDSDGAGNDRGETLRMNGRGREGTHQGRHSNGRKGGELWVQARFRLHRDHYQILITQLCRAGPTGEGGWPLTHVGSQCPFRPDERPVWVGNSIGT